MAANAGRYPVSAQCRILGVPRSTYHRMLANPPAPPAPDPIEPDVLGAFGASRGGYGARRLKVALARSGITASRRRICRISGENGPPGAYSGRGPGASRPAAPPDAADALGRGFDGHRPRTHVAADLTYVRAGSRWCYVCLLVDLHDREIVGCSCGRRKDASLVKAAFSNVEFPLTGIKVFHSDRGAESCNAGIDAPLTAFGIDRSASGPGDPHDDAVVESTSRILERELVAGGRFASEEGLRAAPFDWADWCNDFRIHSTLGYMSPVEFREAGLILS